MISCNLEKINFVQKIPFLNIVIGSKKKFKWNNKNVDIIKKKSNNGFSNV